MKHYSTEGYCDGCGGYGVVWLNGAIAEWLCRTCIYRASLGGD